MNERRRAGLKTFWIYLNLACPVLVPVLVGGLLVFPLLMLSAFFTFNIIRDVFAPAVLAELDPLLVWICLGLTGLVVGPWAWRNIRFQEFAEDLAKHEKDKERKSDSMAARKAFRQMADSEAKRQGHPGVPVPKFVLAAGLLTVLAVFVIARQYSAPYAVNALLCGSLVGALCAGITRLIVDPAIESAIIHGGLHHKASMKRVIIGTYFCLFVLSCAALVCIAFWVAHQTASQKSTFVWEWVAE